MNHICYMQQALDLAKLAQGKTSPNPLVGCVIVNHGQVVGCGYHKAAGTAHAEVHALAQAGVAAQGATMYVTLEPCAHHGRTPPCFSQVIQAGISKVFVAIQDPNPLVAGKGIAQLRAAGIEVEVGLLAAAAAQLNEVFIKWMLTKQPFIVSKLATSFDGKVATKSGESKWLTNSTSRQRGHQLRALYDAILVGVNTVIADDPLLTCRLPQAEVKQPLRLILDSTGRTPLSAKLLHDRSSQNIIITTELCPPAQQAAYRDLGAQVLLVKQKQQRIDLVDALQQLAAMQVQSILVEGGATINGAFYDAGLVDKVHLFIGSILLGGANDLVAIAGAGVERLSAAMSLQIQQAELQDNNIWLTAYNANRVGQWTDLVTATE